MLNSELLHISEDTWHTYRQQLYTFIVKRVSDHLAAEDITQEVLIRVYTRLDTLNDHDKLLPWLYQIARNAIIDYYRRSRDEAEMPDSLAQPEQDDLPSAYQQLAPCLRSLIHQIPAPYQEAVFLSEIEGLTQNVVAQQIGLSLPGAKSRVQRGRKLLKELLFQCCQLQLDSGGRLMDFQSKSNCETCQQNSDPCS